jgi:hypothetical protein
VWRYGVPTLSLIPTLLLLQAQAVSPAVVFVAVAAILALVLVAIRGATRLSGLINALTLAEHP